MEETLLYLVGTGDIIVELFKAGRDVLLGRMIFLLSSRQACMDDCSDLPTI